MGKHIDQTTKDLVVTSIKQDGLTVIEAADKFKVSTKAIYHWLSDLADNGHTSILEMNKLRRENQQLKEIIGMLMLDQEKTKKNR